MSGTLIPVEGDVSAGTSNPVPEPVIVLNGTTAVKKEPPLQVHYNELLRVISDIGRDVKPAYTCSKISTDKLRKNIMMARTILRECQADLEKIIIKD